MLTIAFLLGLILLCWFVFCTSPKEHTKSTQPPRWQGVLSSIIALSMRRKEKKRQQLLMPPSPIVRITLLQLLRHHRDLYLLVSPHGEETSIPTLLTEMARLHQDIEVQIFRKGLIGS